MTYNNRQSQKIATGCSPCKGTTPSAENNTVVTPKLESDIAKPTNSVQSLVSTGSKCWTVKPLSITKVGNEVFILFDDCSFMKAPLSCLNMDSLITEVEDNLVTKVLDKIEDKLISVDTLSGTAFKAFPSE